MSKSDPAMSARSSSWPALLTVQAVLLGEIERRLAAAGLPPLAWYDVLWGLERAPGQRLRMHELAEQVVLTRSNLTRLVDRLETAGLLRREADPGDRRGAFAVPTADGLALRKRMWPTYASAISELYDTHLTAAEQDVLGSAMRKILGAARG